MILGQIYGEEAPNGFKLKEKAKEKKTGLAYQKYHYFSDVLEYLLCNKFIGDGQKFEKGRTKKFQGFPGKLLARGGLIISHLSLAPYTRYKSHKSRKLIRR